MDHPKEPDMTRSAQLEPLLKLPLGERLQLVQDLWDSIVDEEHALPVTDWQVAELQRRAARYEASGRPSLSWEEVERMAERP